MIELLGLFVFTVTFIVALAVGLSLFAVIFTVALRCSAAIADWHWRRSKT